MEEPIKLEGEIELERRSFFKKFGFAGLGAAAAAFIASPNQAKALGAIGFNNPALPPDTPRQIMTAALIAEDLATCFYYVGLSTAAIIQDPALAGPGGTATSVSAGGDRGNVPYVQAALLEEIAHANLWRALLGIPGTGESDPYTTFYFPTAMSTDLTSFLAYLDVFENAFIGAYLTAVQEISQIALATDSTYISGFPRLLHPYYAKVAASIAAVEGEHRVLGRVIGKTNPVNDKSFEQTDGLTGVYNGRVTAVQALSPFLAPMDVPYTTISLADALAATPGLTSNVMLNMSGNNPPANMIG